MMRKLRLFQFSSGRFPGTAVVLMGGVLATASCRQDMHDMPRYEPLEESTFFADGAASRPLVEGTVARGLLMEDELLYQGRINGEVAEIFPFPITGDVLRRGRERYDIFCSPCHARTGDGAGMIVQRGFRPPPDFHSERMREAPVGHYFDVVTNGFGSMYAYADRISPRDRWAIAAYIRALQFSRQASPADVPEADRPLLEGRGQ